MFLLKQRIIRICKQALNLKERFGCATEQNVTQVNGSFWMYRGCSDLEGKKSIHLMPNNYSQCLSIILLICMCGECMNLLHYIRLL